MARRTALVEGRIEPVFCQFGARAGLFAARDGLFVPCPKAGGTIELVAATCGVVQKGGRMRFAKGDYVVHPGQGVCEVAGVAERLFVPLTSADAPEVDTQPQTRLEYELYPVSGPRLRICFPIEKEDDLRAPVSRTEALALIRELPSLQDDPFTDPHAWTVEEHFVVGLRHGDCREALRIAKTMRARIEETRASGRKPKVCYDRIFKAARERALVELGIALGKTTQEVEQLLEASLAVVR